jgi:site-specific DNA-cytosine methylase
MEAPMNCVSLFSGFGGKTIGAKQSGFTPVLSVEADLAIAEVYADNLGKEHLVCDGVENVNFLPFADVDLGLASPPCIRASQANPFAGETDLDILLGATVAKFLRQARPKLFVLENVYRYRTFASFKIIGDQLDALGYRWTYDHVNFADYGVPQARRRLILRAVRDQAVPPLPEKTPQIGWYAAVQDIIENLPDGKLAQWQIDRFPDWLKEIVEGRFLMTDNYGQPKGTENRTPQVLPEIDPAATIRALSNGGALPKAILVERKQANKWGDQFRDAERPAPTVVSGDRPANLPAAVVVTGSEMRWLRPYGPEEPIFAQTAHAPRGNPPKAILFDGFNASRTLTANREEEPAMTICAGHYRRKASEPQGLLLNESASYRIKVMDIPAIARFQTFPDDYRFPADRKLACKGIGNAAPCEGMRRILTSLRCVL